MNKYIPIAVMSFVFGFGFGVIATVVWMLG